MYKFFIKVNNSILEVDRITYQNYLGEKALFERFIDLNKLHLVNKTSEFLSYTTFHISKDNQLLPVHNVRCRPNWSLAEEMFNYITNNYANISEYV